MRISDWSSDVCSSDLRPDSRYNIDSRVIGQNFAIGVDVLKVFAVGDTYSCVDPHKMDVIDRFAWQMQNTAGVRSVLSLPQIAKQVRAGWFEGAPKWRGLPRNQPLSQLVPPVPSQTGSP